VPALPGTKFNPCIKTGKPSIAPAITLDGLNGCRRGRHCDGDIADDRHGCGRTECAASGVNRNRGGRRQIYGRRVSRDTRAGRHNGSDCWTAAENSVDVPRDGGSASETE
jgi:hypothetical protein